MFDIFKRKKKQAETDVKANEQIDEQVLPTEENREQEAAQQNAAEAAIESIEPASGPALESTTVEATAVKETAIKETDSNESPAEMKKAGIPASEETVFFQDTADQNDETKTEKKKGFFSRLATGLSKTRSGFSDGVANLLLGKKEIDDDLLEDLETQLVMADVGVEATREIMAKLTERVGRKELTDSDALFEALIEELQGMLSVCQQPLIVDSSKKPYVILMVGINGVGKTTTIGKLAKQFQAKGKTVMLAAGDTFRAAAVEQLQVWGERNDVPVVAQHTGADSASVLYDAVEAATARGVDILIADTAGRLHTKDNLMGELEKVVRVMKKIDPEAPHEVMLVLDAGTGQNALNQATQFQKSVGVTGLTLTKLDGTAKGGVIFALAKQLGLPVRFIGIGEGINDLRPFDANDFTRALFDKESL